MARETDMKNIAINPLKRGLGLRLWLAAGIAAPCILFASPAMSASFDCSKNGSANEKIICDDPELSAMDEQLAKLFKQARKKAADRRAFNAASDQQWLWREKNCHSRECLVDWYRKRQTELKANLDAAIAAEKAGADATAAATTSAPKSAPVATAEAAPSKQASVPKGASKDVAATPLASLAPSAQAAVAEAETALNAQNTSAAKTDSRPVGKSAATSVAKSAAKAIPANADTTVQKPSTLQLALSSTQIDGVAPEGAAARPHYISAERGEYIYTDPDAKEGDTLAATVSVHYLGIENGQYILEAKRANVYTRYTCSADCALIGALQLPGDVEKDMVILKNDHTSLPSQMVSDAINGLLAESGKH